MLDRIRHDLAWRLLRDGYRALEEERRERDGADAFESRMLGHRTVVVRGRDGARLFYDEDLVARSGAIPPPLGWLLFGRGAVHSLDGAEHRERKDMFLDVLDRERTLPLVEAVRTRLAERVPGWARGVDVFEELVQVYGGAVLAWAGIRLEDEQVALTSRRMAEIVDGFGFAGPAYLRGWRSRVLLNRWAAGLVRDVRAGTLLVPQDRALAMIAVRRDLPDRTAGVELLNVLRPTVAVAWPATMALAHLLRLPDPGAVTSDDRVLTSYLHECRRLQPFAPALTGLAKRDDRHGGVDIRRGDRVLLDIVGTHTDPRSWSLDGGGAEIRDFDPRRFAGPEPDPYALVPQGGGDPATGHRCPGEPLTVRLLAVTLQEVSRHGLRPITSGPLELDRMPTLPSPPLRVAGATPDADGAEGYHTVGRTTRREEPR